VVAEQVVVELAGLTEKGVKVGVPLRQQGPVGSERGGGQPGQLARTGQPRPETHFATSTIVEEDLAVRRQVASLESSATARFALQPRQCELDVLASAQRIGVEVGTGAMVVAGPQASNADTVGAL